MIIHASKDFATRFKCQLSLAGEAVKQDGRLDAWSGHILKLGRESIALMMNDATLYMVIIPLKGVTTFEKFLKLFLNRIAEVWARHGVTFDRMNQTLLLLKRTNRSFIGSMNEAAFLLHDDVMDQIKERGSVDWTASEQGLNDVIFKALQYGTPSELLELRLSQLS